MDTVNGDEDSSVDSVQGREQVLCIPQLPSRAKASGAAQTSAVLLTLWALVTSVFIPHVHNHKYICHHLS